MSCASLIKDTYDYDFPYDWEAGILRLETVVSLKEVVHSIGAFLGIFEEQAYQVFFDTARNANIDIIGFIDGVFRPARQEASKEMLECASEMGLNEDWQLAGWTLNDDWLFDITQIDKMMNTTVRGCEIPFSIKQFLSQEKSTAARSRNLAKPEGDLNACFDAHSTTYPPELHLALRAWREVSANPQPKNKKGITTQIEQWLDKNNPGLSDAARKRIGIVANWYKAEITPKKRKLKNN